MKSIKLNHDGTTRRFAVNVTEYVNGGTAVELLEADTGETYCTLSVWFPESPLLEPGWFFLKDWSENGGITEQMKLVGLLVPVKGVPPVHSGFVTAYAYRLNL